MKPFFTRANPKKNFIVNYTKDFDFPIGILGYLRFKLSISIKSLAELFGLLAIIKTISSLLQKSIMEVYKQSRGRAGLVLNITSFQKVYVFSLMILIPNFLSNELRVPLVTVTLIAYQLAYL